MGFRYVTACYWPDLSFANPALYSDDRTVVPWTSSYFALLNTTDQKPIPRTELPLYKDDYIGLRALDDRGAVHEDTCRGEHVSAFCC